MTNMSYCRFKNTVKNLIDCKEALDDGDYKECSSRERSSIHELIALCEEISATYKDSSFKFDEEDID